MRNPAIPREPRATYRLQLTPAFGFAAAEAQLDYLDALGISELYLSPIFTATAGSTHGYDVTDYTAVSEELGGRSGFDRLCDAALLRGMGLLLDFVPNHMGTLGPDNRWWRDVLRFGPRSHYADFFDIQWDRHAGDRPRVLLPVLETHAGQVIAAGKIRLEAAGGGLVVAYGEERWPVNVEGIAFLLSLLPAGVAGDLPGDFGALAARPPAAATAEAFAAEADAAEQRLAEQLALAPAFAEAWRQAIAAANRAPYRELAALLQLQHYRLARWKAGIHEINYRRFFAISSLVGLRMESPRVFDAVHATLAELLRHPAVTGLRIDHVDGLREPAGYLDRLQQLARRVRGAPIYLAVEKILNGGEQLPRDWPVHGATGYEFIPRLAGVLVSPTAERTFQTTYARVTGDHADFAATMVAKKEQIMRELFPDVVGMLGWQLSDLIAEDPRWDDFSRHELTVAVVRLTAHLPVYRTYRAPDGVVSPADVAVIATAAKSAIAQDPRQDPAPLQFLRQLLTGVYPPPEAPAEYRARVLQWVLTWQQYTGAIMAKAVEDTAYYTYVRFVGLNEVGGDPGSFGGPPADFHQQNERRRQAQPRALLATSTHDTKLSEDVRARLYGLSEYSAEWPGWVAAWEAAVRPHTIAVAGGEAPDVLDRYRLYQILLGAWPLEPARADATFRTRLRDHLRKAVSEAKRWTSDVRPNVEYLAACDRFVDCITDPACSEAFLSAFLPAAGEIAATGARLALAQLVLKATSPGIPDFYQGCEGWSLSLVDPDNRRPVDYRALHALQREARQGDMARLLEDWRTGAVKLRVMETLLNFRRSQPRLFAEGDYVPLIAEGPFPVVAYLRTLGNERLAVVVPQRHRLTPDRAEKLQASRIHLPVSSQWTDLFTGRSFPGHAAMNLSDVLSALPFAVLRSG